MPDNLNNPGYLDDIRININQEHELGYWAKKLEVTKEKLLAAVSAVGPMVKDIKKYLGK